MSTLHKKRDEFRQQIRRSQLDKYRDQKRKSLLESQTNYQILHKVDSIFSNLEEMLVQVAKNYQSINSKMTSASYLDEPANFSDVVGCFQQLKSLAPSQFEQIFTKYMLDKKSTERLMRIFQDLVTNEAENDNQDEEVRQKYNPILRERILYEIIKFLDTLSYIVIGYESSFSIINGIWRVMTEDVLYSEIDQFGFLRYTLSILTKLLEDTKNETIYRHMVQKGVGSQIVKFIDRISNVKVPLEIHDNLLHLISNYLACELMFPPKSSDMVGDITLQTSAVNEKEIFLFYCVVFIDKNEEELYPAVFSALSKLIELHEFLASTLKDEYLTKIASLIINPKRDIQVQSLNLLNDFTFYSQHCIDYLLREGYLLDILHKRLMIESTAQDSHVIPNVQKIAYVICNSLLTQNQQLKKIGLSHYIWQNIFSSFHPSQKLFPLIMVMEYFFEANGHKNFDKYLRPYLETLRNFEWKQSRYSKSIQKSIQSTFLSAMNHWQDHQYKNFLKILYENGFLYLVEQQCEPEDLTDIKVIQME